MTAKVICFGSAKGGAGKTVTMASIGAFLAALGKRVLLIDTDAATNGLTLLYLQEVLAHAAAAAASGHEPTGIYEQGLSSQEMIDTVPLRHGVHLVPATYHFLDTEEQSFDQYRAGLGNVIALSRRDYDYVLLDAQAGSDIFAQYAMSKDVSDIVVLVSEYDPMSAAGLERLKGVMNRDLTYVRTWVLLNKILPEFARNFSSFLEVSKYLSPIPWDAHVVRAYARRRLPLDLENGNTYTLAIMRTVKTLLGEEIEDSISHWASSRAEAIRRPLELQYEDLERELAGIMQDTAELEGISHRSGLLVTASMAVALVASLIGAIFSSNASLGEILAKPSIGDVVALSGLTVALMIGLFWVYLKVREMRRGRPFELELEKAKLQRRRALIEDSLRQLEVLRVADLETLLDPEKTKLNYKRKP
jgi:cellulose biosynthesis protein BcsQ